MNKREIWGGGEKVLKTGTGHLARYRAASQHATILQQYHSTVLRKTAMRSVEEVLFERALSSASGAGSD